MQKRCGIGRPAHISSSRASLRRRSPRTRRPPAAKCSLSYGRRNGRTPHGTASICVGWRRDTAPRPFQRACKAISSSVAAFQSSCSHDGGSAASALAGLRLQVAVRLLLHCRHRTRASPEEAVARRTEPLVDAVVVLARGETDRFPRLLYLQQPVAGSCSSRGATPAIAARGPQPASS